MYEREKQNYLFDICCSEVTKTIGADISPDKVAGVIELSNRGGHIFHGIKRYKYFLDVIESGILPKTPEGGMVSCWCVGSRIFWSELTLSNKLNTYDTAFFHYGHCAREDSSLLHMAIALTNRQVLSQIGQVRVEKNSLVTVKFPVPRSLICLLHVDLKIDSGERNSAFTPRQHGQVLENEMFNLIEECLVGGYKLGEKKTSSVLLQGGKR